MTVYRWRDVLARKLEGLTGKNLAKPMLDVRHAELERADMDSPYRSKCPSCSFGTLLVGRDRNMVLQEEDRCTLCGQAVRYLDVGALREREMTL